MLPPRRTRRLLRLGSTLFPLPPPCSSALRFCFMRRPPLWYITGVDSATRTISILLRESDRGAVYLLPGPSCVVDIICKLQDFPRRQAILPSTRPETILRLGRFRSSCASLTVARYYLLPVPTCALRSTTLQPRITAPRTVEVRSLPSI